jgi:hypothetical protein
MCGFLIHWGEGYSEHGAVRHAKCTHIFVPHLKIGQGQVGAFVSEVCEKGGTHLEDHDVDGRIMLIFVMK